jgi:OPA family glycerol-3-phosphate transporter-like MFS transporter
MKIRKTRIRQRLKVWRNRILIITWITYTSFYLCRVNMSIAMPGIMDEFGISKTEMGGILTALFSAYAIGQFVNGQLGDKYGARKIITIGILSSALLNIIFGFSTGVLILMMLIWALNGYFQSMGWSLSVKTIANWFPLKKRGKASAVLGTSYQVGNAASWGLAGLVIGVLGWRWGFWIPALIFIVIAVFWYNRARNAPEEAGLVTIEEGDGEKSEKGFRKDNYLGFRYTFKQCLMNPRVWIVALGLFFLNIVRYGFLSWAPTYMFEVQKATISTAAYKAVAIPVAGSIGAIYAGWLSDKKFQSRRAPMAVIMLFILSIVSFLYPLVPTGDWITSLILLILVGFMLYGPHVLMVTTIPMDYGTRKAAASTAGFIDGWGYIGAAITGVTSGWLIDNYGWNAAFNFWIVSVIGAAVLMAMLWNYKPKKSKYH